MLHKKIRTKAQAAKVAKELAQDIEKETDHYLGYEVDTIHDKYGYHIKFATRDEYPSLIITATAAETVKIVLDTYMLLYDDIDYHYGVSGTKDGQYKSIIWVNVNIR